jgi:hypothetical protein
MMIRRIFAGSTVALLLSVSSLAPACDVSCAFAHANSDCHSREMKAQRSAPADMTMAGMTMPETSGDNSMNQQMVSAPSRPMPVHAAVMDMGTCEHQSCDQAPVLVVKANHPTAAKSYTVRALTEFALIASLQTTFHGARDDLARLGPIVHAPLSVSLRI